MNLKKTLGILGKRLASAGAAVSIGISATAGSPLPDREGHEIRQVKKEQAPRRSVEDLENAVRDRVWINGKPQSERIHEIRKIRETEGSKAAFDYLEQSKYEKGENCVASYVLSDYASSVQNGISICDSHLGTRYGANSG